MRRQSFKLHVDGTLRKKAFGRYLSTESFLDSTDSFVSVNNDSYFDNAGSDLFYTEQTEPTDLQTKVLSFSGVDVPSAVGSHEAPVPETAAVVLGDRLVGHFEESYSSHLLIDDIHRTRAARSSQTFNVLQLCLARSPVGSQHAFTHADQPAAELLSTHISEASSHCASNRSTNHLPCTSSRAPSESSNCQGQFRCPNSSQLVGRENRRSFVLKTNTSCTAFQRYRVAVTSASMLPSSVVGYTLNERGQSCSNVEKVCQVNASSGMSPDVTQRQHLQQRESTVEAGPTSSLSANFSLVTAASLSECSLPALSTPISQGLSKQLSLSASTIKTIPSAAVMAFCDPTSSMCNTAQPLPRAVSPLYLCDNSPAGHVIPLAVESSSPIINHSVGFERHFEGGYAFEIAAAHPTSSSPWPSPPFAPVSGTITSTSVYEHFDQFCNATSPQSTPISTLPLSINGSDELGVALAPYSDSLSLKQNPKTCASYQIVDQPIAPLYSQCGPSLIVASSNRKKTKLNTSHCNGWKMGCNQSPVHSPLNGSVLVNLSSRFYHRQQKSVISTNRPNSSISPSDTPLAPFHSEYRAGEGLLSVTKESDVSVRPTSYLDSAVNQLGDIACSSSSSHRNPHDLSALTVEKQTYQTNSQVVFPHTEALVTDIDQLLIEMQKTDRNQIVQTNSISDETQLCLRESSSGDISAGAYVHPLDESSVKTGPAIDTGPSAFSRLPVEPTCFITSPARPTTLSQSAGITVMNNKQPNRSGRWRRFRRDCQSVGHLEQLIERQTELDDMTHFLQSMCDQLHRPPPPLSDPEKTHQNPLQPSFNNSTCLTDICVPVNHVQISSQIDTEVLEKVESIALQSEHECRPQCFTSIEGAPSTTSASLVIDKADAARILAHMTHLPVAVPVAETLAEKSCHPNGNCANLNLYSSSPHHQKLLGMSKLNQASTFSPAFFTTFTSSVPDNASACHQLPDILSHSDISKQQSACNACRTRRTVNQLDGFAQQWLHFCSLCWTPLPSLLLSRSNCPISFCSPLSSQLSDANVAISTAAVSDLSLPNVPTSCDVTAICNWLEKYCRICSSFLQFVNQFDEQQFPVFCKNVLDISTVFATIPPPQYQVSVNTDQMSSSPQSCSVQDNLEYTIEDGTGRCAINDTSITATDVEQGTSNIDDNMNKNEVFRRVSCFEALIEKSIMLLRSRLHLDGVTNEAAILSASSSQMSEFLGRLPRDITCFTPEHVSVHSTCSFNQLSLNEQKGNHCKCGKRDEILSSLSGDGNCCTSSVDGHCKICLVSASNMTSNSASSPIASPFPDDCVETNISLFHSAPQRSELRQQQIEYPQSNRPVNIKICHPLNLAYRDGGTSKQTVVSDTQERFDQFIQDDLQTSTRLLLNLTARIIRLAGISAISNIDEHPNEHFFRRCTAPSNHFEGLSSQSRSQLHLHQGTMKEPDVMGINHLMEQYKEALAVREQVLRRGGKLWNDLVFSCSPCHLCWLTHASGCSAASDCAPIGDTRAPHLSYYDSHRFNVDHSCCLFDNDASHCFSESDLSDLDQPRAAKCCLFCQQPKQTAHGEHPECSIHLRRLEWWRELVLLTNCRCFLNILQLQLKRCLNSSFTSSYSIK